MPSRVANGVGMTLAVGLILLMASSQYHVEDRVHKTAQEAHLVALKAAEAAERAEATARRKMTAAKKITPAALPALRGPASITTRGQSPSTQLTNQPAVPKAVQPRDSFDVTAAAANCPDEALYLAMWITKRAKKGHVWRIADIGINKGYTIAAMLSAMKVPEYSPPDLALEMMQHIGFEKFKWSLCGACCDCMDAFDWNKMRDHPWYKAIGSAEYKARVGGVNVWGVDPTRVHVDWNRKYFSKPGITTPLNFTFVRAFASDATGSAKFRDGAILGNEVTNLNHVNKVSAQTR
eukprot:TRINITY_DN1247_c0_g5_i2.p1 TRINITY_DN1247_c0_g5~~TRINITY_DN1247_c0_g5_i2.p1  ORF type:complete len:293 (+),score=60.23 TRINITY_DN1247_c0_g5_i2:45-923(+)